MQYVRNLHRIAANAIAAKERFQLDPLFGTSKLLAQNIRDTSRLAKKSSNESSDSECWVISNVKGYSASADTNYEYSKDSLPNVMMLCFIDADQGSVTGTDTKLIRFGKSTLAGYGNIKVVELFEVYQIDRENGKLLYSKSRIGTKTAYPLFSDTVMNCIGDAVMAPNSK